MATVVEFPQRAKGTIEDPIICHCLGVTASTIRSAIDDSGARTSQEISCLTTAGTGCGSCHCRLERLLAGLPAAVWTVRTLPWLWQGVCYLRLP